MQKNKFGQIVAISIVIIFLLTGCLPKLKIPSAETGKYPGGGGPIKPADEEKATLEEKLIAQNKIKKFESFDELREFIEDASASVDLPYGRGIMPGASVADDMLWDGLESSVQPGLANKPTALKSAPGMDGAGDSKGYSKTNVQVEGVDEADIIKTDGKYIYTVVKNNLFIAEAYPAESSRIIAKIEFKSRPRDIYINGDYLAIYGRNYQIREQSIYKNFRRRGNYTFLKIFNISDRKNPRLLRSLDFEGNYSNSRMIGDYIYFVTAHNNYYYIEGEPILPRILDNGQNISAVCEEKGKCIVPDIYYFDVPYSSYNFTTITGIDIKNNSKPLSSDFYLMAGNQNMYVSNDNIYISYTKYISEYELETEVLKEIIVPRLSDKSRGMIAKIEATENFILSHDEKRNKISRIIEQYSSSLDENERILLEKELTQKMKQKYNDISKELEKTVIHKIGIKGNELTYKTFGEVTGHVLNQFSMDENNGYFRIATTKNRAWSKHEENRTESYSNLYVLDKDMKVVGGVENLAKGERIYSVRFMQNRAYMVTFKQTDPLFVIDLKDPKKPTVLGELKIPGFSNYLHPYDEKTLIGIGKDTTTSEWGGVLTGGVKLSLFDVSDVANPKEIDTYVMGDAGSDSIALYDHKAFLLAREKNLLVIPISIRESTGIRRNSKLTFSGAAVFKVDRSGFSLLGKIDHSDGGQAAPRDYWRGINYYDNTVKRSLYIEDVLYTFSNNYLGMNKIDDLAFIKNLKLIKNKGQDDDFTIIN